MRKYENVFNGDFNYGSKSRNRIKRRAFWNVSAKPLVKEGDLSKVIVFTTNSQNFGYFTANDNR